MNGSRIAEHRTAQCKHIPDAAVIDAVKATPGYWRTWRECRATFESRYGSLPDRLFIAKARSLDKRGLLHACVHDGPMRRQCRGDIHLPEECTGC